MTEHDRRLAEDRLALAFELFEDGVEMTRERLRREHPDATSERIELWIGEWLRSRPAAPIGDADGKPIRLPRS